MAHGEWPTCVGSVNGACRWTGSGTLTDHSAHETVVTERQGTAPDTAVGCGLADSGPVGRG